MSNAQLKLVGKLSQKKFRNELKLFVAEGLRLCEEVPPAQIEFGFFTREFLSDGRAMTLIERVKKFAPLEEISSSAMEKISDTQTPQGILLVARQKFSTLEEVVAKKIIVVLDGVQDPGNVGTILRTAEAFGCGVIMLDGSAEIFNPKVVRSSMGAIFYLPLIKISHEDFLNLRGIKILAAALDSSAEIYSHHDFTQSPVAIVFGSEAVGVSEKILNVAKKIFIPMSGRAESLNVATSAAIILSEAVRQNAKNFSVVFAGT
ncbi:MAG: RNA methyltransferase [Selenomonadaceae bacterium]|nr:RNA methyltransferase [Selenomonadaceae bacterium]